VIFVDTSLWAAAGLRRDPHRTEAGRLLDACRSESLVTTNHVRGETWTLLRRRADHRIALRFLQTLERSPRLQVVHVSADLEDEALAWLRRHDEREYSFVDATSFALMRSLGIHEALAFDGDFAAAGFVELRA
jgi:predicted nucleic acid-binding protein